MTPSTRLGSAFYTIAAHHIFHSRTACAVQNLCTADTLLDLCTADVSDLDTAHSEPELLTAYAPMLDQQSHSTFPLSVLENSKPDLGPWYHTAIKILTENTWWYWKGQSRTRWGEKVAYFSIYRTVRGCRPHKKNRFGGSCNFNSLKPHRVAF